MAPPPPPEACGGAQVGPRRPRRRAPDRPSALRGILYNSPSRSKRKRGARCPGRPAEVLTPGARGAPHAASRRGGKGPERPPRASPRKGARSWPVPFRKPRASPTASASSNTMPCLSPAREPPAAGPGPRAALASAPRGRRKFPGTLPSPAPAQPRRQHPCPGVGNLGPLGCARPLLPSELARHPRGSRPGPSGRSATLKKLPKAGKPPGVPEHRSYLALRRPRSGRAARGAWCTSARAWGGR